LKEINTDFCIDQFVDTEIELWAIGEYLDALEKYLPFMKEQERLKTNAWLKRKSSELDESDIAITLHELQDIVDHVFPRFFHSPFLVALWSVYESAIINIASYLQKRDNISLSLKDIRGGNFLERAKKYFDGVLHFPLCIDNHIWEWLDMLLLLRHAIAHTNGRIASIKPKKNQEKIRKWVEKGIGISDFTGSLIFSEDFLQQSYSIVDELLKDFLKRVREQRDRKKNSHNHGMNSDW